MPLRCRPGAPAICRPGGTIEGSGVPVVHGGCRERCPRGGGQRSWPLGGWPGAIGAPLPRAPVPRVAGGGGPRAARQVGLFACLRGPVHGVPGGGFPRNLAVGPPWSVPSGRAVGPVRGPGRVPLPVPGAPPGRALGERLARALPKRRPEGRVAADPLARSVRVPCAGGSAEIALIVAEARPVFEVPLPEVGPTLPKFSADGDVVAEPSGYTCDVQGVSDSYA